MHALRGNFVGIVATGAALLFVTAVVVGLI